MKRLLLLSNSTNVGELYLEYPKAAIANFLGPDVKSVLFVPYAGVGISYDDYTLKTSNPFLEMGYEVNGIHTYSDPVEAVKGADAIAVGGGNTFELLKQLYKYDLIGSIQTKVEEGMPFMGWSAGSNIAGPTIRTTNDMPIVEPPSFDALGLVPFQINPHYTEERLPNHGGETRKDRLNEFVALNPDIEVVGIPEGNLLEIIGNQVRLIGLNDVKVFRRGQNVRNFKAGDDLDFLLNSK